MVPRTNRGYQSNQDPRTGQDDQTPAGLGLGMGLAWLVLGQGLDQVLDMEQGLEM